MFIICSRINFLLAFLVGGATYAEFEDAAVAFQVQRLHDSFFLTLRQMTSGMMVRMPMLLILVIYEVIYEVI